VLKHDTHDSDWRGWDYYEDAEDREVPVFMCRALGEHYYGSLQGLDKRRTADLVGQEGGGRWRRSCSSHPPGGVSFASQFGEGFAHIVIAALRSRFGDLPVRRE
jgi:hypothetical protein